MCCVVEVDVCECRVPAKFEMKERKEFDVRAFPSARRS